MEPTIIVAIIAALGAVATAWVTKREQKKTRGENSDQHSQVAQRLEATAQTLALHTATIAAVVNSQSTLMNDMIGLRCDVRDLTTALARDRAKVGRTRPSSSDGNSSAGSDPPPKAQASAPGVGSP